MNWRLLLCSGLYIGINTDLCTGIKIYLIKHNHIQYMTIFTQKIVKLDTICAYSHVLYCSNHKTIDIASRVLYLYFIQ